MTVMTVLRTARTFVTLAVVSVAASTVLGAGATASATGDHHPDQHPDRARATKEWKGNTRAVLATKEWKVSTSAVKPLTKEW
jgi:hypothetical protein